MCRFHSLLLGLVVAASSTVALSAHSVGARTLTVSKDGSGDFSIIQNAIDASAPGDTIRLASGVYVDSTDFQLDCCQSMPTYAGVHVDNLTMIGAHRDSVFIGGPERPQITNTALGMRVGASAGFRLESVTVRGATYGLRIMDSAVIRDVRVSECWIGAFTFPDSGAVIEDCLFEKCSSGAVSAGSGSRFVSIRNCRFVNNSAGVNFTWSYEPEMRGCEFEGTVGTSIVASGGGVHLMLFDTTVRGYGSGVLFANNDAAVTARRCTFEGLAEAAIHVSSASQVDIQECTLIGGSIATVGITASRAEFLFTGNDVIRGSGDLVRLDDFPEQFGNPTFHFPNNYWGTTNVDSLDAWIYDSRADSTIQATVDIYPILDTSVPTQEGTVGGLKARYGGGE